MKKTLLAGVAAAMVGAIAAHASGFWTNGLTASLGPRGTELMPADVQTPGSTNGAAGSPLSVALSAAQIAGLSVPFATNTGTSVAGAVTINKKTFAITTESLSTAVGSTFTETVTNSTIAATSNVQCSSLSPISDVTAARWAVQSITPASGSLVIVWYNNGTAAASGTWGYGCTVYSN